MMCSDNILYYSYVAFETYKDLAEHLKQDATKKFIKCAAVFRNLTTFGLFKFIKCAAFSCISPVCAKFSLCL